MADAPATDRADDRVPPAAAPAATPARQAVHLTASDPASTTPAVKPAPLRDTSGRGPGSVQVPEKGTYRDPGTEKAAAAVTGAKLPPGPVASPTAGKAVVFPGKPTQPTRDIPSIMRPLDELNARHQELAAQRAYAFIGRGGGSALDRARAFAARRVLGQTAPTIGADGMQTLTAGINGEPLRQTHDSYGLRGRVANFAEQRRQSAELQRIANEQAQNPDAVVVPRMTGNPKVDAGLLRDLNAHLQRKGMDKTRADEFTKRWEQRNKGEQDRNFVEGERLKLEKEAATALKEYRQSELKAKKDEQDAKVKETEAKARSEKAAALEKQYTSAVTTIKEATSNIASHEKVIAETLATNPNADVSTYRNMIRMEQAAASKAGQLRDMVLDQQLAEKKAEFAAAKVAMDAKQAVTMPIAPATAAIIKETAKKLLPHATEADKEDLYAVLGGHGPQSEQAAKVWMDTAHKHYGNVLEGASGAAATTPSRNPRATMPVDRAYAASGELLKGNYLSPAEREAVDRAARNIVSGTNPEQAARAIQRVYQLHNGLRWQDEKPASTTAPTSDMQYDFAAKLAPLNEPLNQRPQMASVEPTLVERPFANEEEARRIGRANTPAVHTETSPVVSDRARIGGAASAKSVVESLQSLANNKQLPAGERGVVLRQQIARAMRQAQASGVATKEHLNLMQYLSSLPDEQYETGIELLPQQQPPAYVPPALR